MCTCMYACVYVHVGTCIHLHVRILLRLCICTYIYMYKDASVCVVIHVSVCVCACVHVFCMYARRRTHSSSCVCAHLYTPYDIVVGRISPTGPQWHLRAKVADHRVLQFARVENWIKGLHWLQRIYKFAFLHNSVYQLGMNHQDLSSIVLQSRGVVGWGSARRRSSMLYSIIIYLVCLSSKVCSSMILVWV